MLETPAILPVTTESVWRSRNFRNVVAANTISALGSQVSFLALPLLAVARLGASPAQMGLLGAAGALPALLMGLGAGVIVDRRRRRPLMVAADLGRAVVLLSVPLAAVLDRLTLAQLYIVAFLSGALTILFAIADRSFLPRVLPREQLLAGNSALELGTSGAEVAGPALAGISVQLLTAAGAVALDALSYIGSAACLARVDVVEPPASGESATSIRHEALAGFRAVAAQPTLRALTLCTATLSLFNGAFDALFLLYLVRELLLDAGWIGLVFAIGSVGSVIGALLAGRVLAGHESVTPLVLGILLAALADGAALLIGGPLRVAVPALIAIQFAFGLGAMLFRVGAVSLRQLLTPDHLLGRVNATFEVIAWGVVPAGALFGGLAATAIGLRETLLIAAVGEALAAGWLIAWRNRPPATPDSH
jgi:MFS family permease